MATKKVATKVVEKPEEVKKAVPEEQVKPELAEYRELVKSTQVGNDDELNERYEKKVAEGVVPPPDDAKPELKARHSNKVEEERVKRAAAFNEKLLENWEKHKADLVARSGAGAVKQKEENAQPLPSPKE